MGGFLGHFFSSVVSRWYRVAYSTVSTGGIIYFATLRHYGKRMAKDSPAQHLDRIMVRLPDGMRDRIAALAEQNGRSMNAEVVARLEASFEHDVTKKTLDELQDEYEKVKVKVTDLHEKFNAYISERLTMRDWTLAAINAAMNGEPAPPMPELMDRP